MTNLVEFFLHFSKEHVGRYSLTFTLADLFSRPFLTHLPLVQKRQNLPCLTNKSNLSTYLQQHRSYASLERAEKLFFPEIMLHLATHISRKS